MSLKGKTLFTVASRGIGLAFALKTATDGANIAIAVYSIAKFGKSLVVLGLAGELRGKLRFNALWPCTTVATVAIRNLLDSTRLQTGSVRCSSYH